MKNTVGFGNIQLQSSIDKVIKGDPRNAGIEVNIYTDMVDEALG